MITDFFSAVSSLFQQEILESFSSIINKTKKFAKQELRTAIEEFEQKIAAAQKTKDEEDDTPAPPSMYCAIFF